MPEVSARNRILREMLCRVLASCLLPVLPSTPCPCPCVPIEHWLKHLMQPAHDLVLATVAARLAAALDPRWNMRVRKCRLACVRRQKSSRRRHEQRQDHKLQGMLQLELERVVADVHVVEPADHAAYHRVGQQNSADAVDRNSPAAKPARGARARRGGRGRAAQGATALSSQNPLRDGRCRPDDGRCCIEGRRPSVLGPCVRLG